MKSETKEQLWEYFSAAIMVLVGFAVIGTGLMAMAIIGGMLGDLMSINWKAIL